MELENLFGLPAHPLLVHLPVVMIPLAALGAILIAVRPGWLDRFGWFVVGFAGVGAIGAILAAGSGEALEERVDETAALEHHAELGETARLVSVIFFLVVLGVVGYRWWSLRRAAAATAPSTDAATDAATAPATAPRWIALVGSALLVLSAVGATVTVVQAGHQGAKVTWDEEQEDGGDDHGDDDHDDHDDDED